MRKLGDLLAGFFFTFIGVGATIGAIKLRVGTATEPQPGFFPFLGGVAITILSAILLIQAWRGRSVGIQTLGDLWRPTALILGLIFYISVLNFLGYIISTTILSAIVLRIMDTKSWWVLTGVGFILAIMTYILFDRLLSMPLPSGILTGIL